MEEFIYGRRTKVYKSCSTILLGKMWIFGGTGKYARQLLSASSSHPHTWTSLGKIESGLVAIGGYKGNNKRGNKVEVYTNGHWVQQPPFPEDEIFDYSTATYENVIYVFGE